MDCVEQTFEGDRTSWETARKLFILVRVFAFPLSPNVLFFLSLSNQATSCPPLSPSFFPLHSFILTKMLHSSNPLWIFKCHWVVQIAVSAASGAYWENLPELDSRGLFSSSMPPRAYSPALSLPRIFLCLVMASCPRLRFH